MTPEELRSITESVTAALAARQTAAPAPPGPGLAPPIMPLSSMTPPPTAPTGAGTLSVALEIPLSDGSTASVHMALPAGSEANLVATIEGLLRAGWPIRTFQPRQTGWGRPSWGQNSYGRRAWR